MSLLPSPSLYLPPYLGLPLQQFDFPQPCVSAPLDQILLCLVLGLAARSPPPPLLGVALSAHMSP
eukprot:15655-Eustigmatos_ZCMA.PRE.1